MISSIFQALFFNQNSAQYEWARKETIQNLWSALSWNQAKVSLSVVYKAKKYFLQEKSFLTKKKRGGLKTKWKEDFLFAIKKDPTISIKKHTNELKVHEKNCVASN